jgi:energy-coupling factor transporter ATP-binding protein EcfA2
MYLMCDVCGRDWPSLEYKGSCVCGSKAWTNTESVRRVQTSLVCCNCGRRGKDPAYHGDCECGESTWFNTSPGSHRDLICDSCGRDWPSPSYKGACKCGSKAWTETSPVRRVETSLVCDLCGRRGKDPAYHGRCECTANAWTNTSPGQRIETSLACDFCGRRGMDPAYRGYCECGAEAWTKSTSKPPLQPVPQLSPSVTAPPGSQPAPRLSHHASAQAHSPTQGSVLDGDSVPPMIVDDYPGAQINELLGGIYRGALVLVVGPAGAGKSTYSAELSAIAAMQLDSNIYWLDRDQKHPVLVRACFATLGTEEAFTRVKLVRPPTVMPKAWGIVEALTLVPDDVDVLVLDSLETWGANDTLRLAVMERMKEHPARVKLVIAGTNAEGGVSGFGALERADDATVYVERKGGKHTLRLGKRRWPPCKAALARASLHASAYQEGDIAEESPAVFLPNAVMGPDFSLDGIARAASWSVREIEAYRAQLRAQGVSGTRSSAGIAPSRSRRRRRKKRPTIHARSPTPVRSRNVRRRRMPSS